jgi:hypothetical protein
LQQRLLWWLQQKTNNERFALASRREMSFKSWWPRSFNTSQFFALRARTVQSGRQHVLMRACIRRVSWDDCSPFVITYCALSPITNQGPTALLYSLCVERERERDVWMNRIFLQRLLCTCI